MNAREQGRIRGQRSPYAATALLVLCTLGCGGSGSDGPGSEGTPIGDAPAWDTVYWANSNSGPTFQWSIDGLAATSWVAATLDGVPSGASGGCSPFGGAVTPGVAAKSMHDQLPGGAPFAIWMQPRDHQFDGVTADGLAAAVQAALTAFQSCVTQDWPGAPVVSGFLCVKEQQLGGDANCDTLASVFAGGVHVPGLASAVRYGLLAAPGSMNRTDVDASLGEMYEPIYFPPGDTCPSPGDGTTYGSAIGDWIAGAAVLPASGSVAVPAFGGPSSTCQLDYDQLAPAAAALAGKVPAGLAGLGVWG